jgi:hypothetical protein
LSYNAFRIQAEDAAIDAVRRPLDADGRIIERQLRNATLHPPAFARVMSVPRNRV